MARGLWRGVENASDLIAPVVVGMDASGQLEIDGAILAIGGRGAKERLGGNATAAVSAATLRAGEGIPFSISCVTLPLSGLIAASSAYALTRLR